MAQARPVLPLVSKTSSSAATANRNPPNPRIPPRACLRLRAAAAFIKSIEFIGADDADAVHALDGQSSADGCSSREPSRTLSSGLELPLGEPSFEVEDDDERSVVAAGATNLELNRILSPDY